MLLSTIDDAVYGSCLRRCGFRVGPCHVDPCLTVVGPVMEAPSWYMVDWVYMLGSSKEVAGPMPC